jgi:hypothetical protein
MPDVVTVAETQGQRYTWGTSGFTWISASAGKNWDTAYPAVYAFAVAVSLAIVESSNRQMIKPSIEGVGITEADRRLMALAKADTIGFTETYSDLIAYVLRWVESLGFAENLSKSHQKTIAETISAADYLTRSLTKASSTAVSWAERLGRQSTVRPSEMLPVLGLHYRQPTIALTEAFGSAEALARQLSKAVTEAISVAETYADLIAYIIRISENIGLADSPAKQISKPLTETFTASDLLSARVVKRVAEAVAMADAFGRTVAYRKALSEGLAINDAVKRSLRLSTHESLLLAEQYRRHANGVISDMIISTGEITEEDFISIVENGHPPGHTNFRDFIQGDYTYQRALFRAILKSSNADRGYIDALRLTVDVPDIFDRGVAEVTNAAAGASVQFSRTFRFIPQVTITHKGGTTTAIPRLLSTPSTIGFVAVLEDKTGTRVTGSFSWLAQGC